MRWNDNANSSGIESSIHTVPSPTSLPLSTHYPLTITDFASRHLICCVRYHDVTQAPYYMIAAVGSTDCRWTTIAGQLKFGRRRMHDHRDHQSSTQVFTQWSRLRHLPLSSMAQIVSVQTGTASGTVRSFCLEPQRRFRRARVEKLQEK
jgi:hypothetical protein